MPHLPKSLHLEYNLTKPLRTSYSIAGITFMASAMAAVFVGALLTKGLTQSTELQYLPHPDTPGYNCNSTLIYPGQLFGSMLLNTSFEYQAMSQFAYRGQNITNCTPTDLTFIDVVGPPLNYPRININQTASCFIPNPDTKGGVTVSFAVNQLLYWGYFDRVSSIEVGVLGINLLAQLATYKATWNTACNSSQPYGFRIDQNVGTIGIFPLDSPGTIICPIQLSQVPDALDLINATRRAMIDDWTTKLTSLPDLLYPCVPRKKVWLPFWTLLLDVLTTMFAFFSPILTAVLLVLQRLQERRTPQHHDEEYALQPSLPPSASFLRDEDPSLLSPSSPRNILNHVQDSRLSVQRLESLVEVLQNRIHHLEDRQTNADLRPDTASQSSDQETTLETNDAEGVENGLLVHEVTSQLRLPISPMET